MTRRANLVDQIGRAIALICAKTAPKASVQGPPATLHGVVLDILAGTAATRRDTPNEGQ
jgi:hypothetical protein